MNIILLIVDTLRYDYLGANGNAWIETPNLDRLAAQSWCFDRAFCNSFPTIPFRTDVIRGTFGDPFYPWHPLRFDVPTLPGILAEHGYATQLIHDTPHLVNGGHAFDYPFHYWTFVRGAEVDRAWLTDPQPAMLANWRRDPLWGLLRRRPAARIAQGVRAHQPPAACRRGLERRAHVPDRGRVPARQPAARQLLPVAGLLRPA